MASMIDERTRKEISSDARRVVKTWGWTYGVARRFTLEWPPCLECGELAMDEFMCPNAKELCTDCCGEEDH